MKSVSTRQMLSQDELRWAVPFDGSWSAPAIADGVLFIGSADGGVYSFDPRTGSQRWRFQTGEGLESGPLVIESESGEVQDMLSAFAEADRGRTDPKREVRSTPTVADGTVYVGSMDTRFYAIDAKTGQVEWSTPLGFYFSGEAIVSEGSVVVTGYRMGVPRPGNSVMFVLDADDGSLKWTTDIHGAVSEPTVQGGVVYSVQTLGEGGSLVAQDVESGEVIWSTDCEGVEPGRPVVRPDIVVVYTHHEISPGILPPYEIDVYAFERESGEIRWMHRAPKLYDSERTISPKNRNMPLDDSRVYLASAEGVFALDVDTGESVWRREGVFIPTSLYLGEHLYVGISWIGLLTGNRTLAMEPESGQVVWEASSPKLMALWHVLDRRIYGNSGSTNLYLLDPDDGSVAWRFSNNGALMHSDPVAFDGGLIFSTKTEFIWGGNEVVDGAQGHLLSIRPAGVPK